MVLDERTAADASPVATQAQFLDPATDHERIVALRNSGRVWSIHDLVPQQLEELVDARLAGDDTSKARAGVRDVLLDGAAEASHGVWVHYPWSGVLVRVLPESQFRELRLDRNRDKITTEELATLQTKRVGVVGLSVGNAVALTLAQEGVAGTLVLADFDPLSTSNLNRVRAAIHDVGLPKTVVAARQIAEIDPFVRVQCFHEGLTEANLAAFLDGLDLVVDECDGLAMKLRLRHACRARRLPVLMETSDRGMLDVERFDLEPDRPILHGRLPELDPDAVKEVSDGERLALVARIVGYDVSTRAAASMLEIGATLSTWPQLASDVALGGATVCAATRQILLGGDLASGRRTLDTSARLQHVDAAPKEEVPAPDSVHALPSVPPLHRALVEAAIRAPSGGNCQPWHFHSRGGHIAVEHVLERSESLLDADGHAGLVSVGAAIEAMSLRARALGHLLVVEPTGAESGEVAIVTPRRCSRDPDPLHAQIDQRFTDRRNPERVPLSTDAERAIRDAVGEGARLELVTDGESRAELGYWIGAVDRVRFLHPDLHAEMWSEVRWTPAEAEARPDGMSLEELAVGPGDAPVLHLLSRPDVAAFLRRRRRGSRLADLAGDWTASASAVGMFSIDDLSPASTLAAGRAIYRAWLAACAAGFALQPIGVAAYMVRHLGTPFEAGYTADDIQTLRQADAALTAHFPAATPTGRLLLFRILKGGERYAHTYRRAIEDVLSVD